MELHVYATRVLELRGPLPYKSDGVIVVPFTG